MQDKTPRNENGHPHGYWEWYDMNDNIVYSAYFINGDLFGNLRNVIGNVIGNSVIKSYYAR